MVASADQIVTSSNGLGSSTTGVIAWVICSRGRERVTMSLAWAMAIALLSFVARWPMTREIVIPATSNGASTNSMLLAMLASLLLPDIVPLRRAWAPHLLSAGTTVSR